MRSMTGFGQAVGENQRYRIAVTLRSFNHRHLDLALRLPEAHRDKEQSLRKLVTEGLERGRVEAKVEIGTLEKVGASVILDREVVTALHAAVAELAREGLLQPDLHLRDVARVPEALRVEVSECEWLEEDQDLLEHLMRQGIEQLVEARTAEGERLAAAIQERLQALGEIARELSAMREVARRQLFERLQERLGELLEELELPQDRLVQEAALLADRSDVQEELDRFEAHLQQCRELLEQPTALGKRLDFLAQEILRELNTLAAKCRDTEMIRRTLDAKVLCEQLREQVQNVE